MLKNGIPIGRAFGIDLRLHYSWFIIFILVTFALTAGYFPTTHPHWSLGTRITVGLITSILFFASVLAHELMHSIVAQRSGIPVHSITLFIFGGVSQMTREPDRPGVEFRMALAGPITSLVLGGLFWLIWYYTRNVSDFITAVSFWLFWINVSLGLFNMIPGFPLDGGRVLRSIIWWFSKNLRRSTKIASTIGRGVGYLFIFIGVYFIFTNNLFNGLWIALIGWFLENAAVGSYRQLALQEILKGHRASEIMIRDCVMVPADLTVDRLVNEYVLSSGRRCFPVREDSRIAGMVTLHNIKSVPQELRSTKTVGEIMTPLEKLKWVTPDADLSNVLQILTEGDINQVPVVEPGTSNIVGMVSRDNLLTFIDFKGGLGV